MDRNIVYGLIVVLTLQATGSAIQTYPGQINCICGGTLAVEVNCNISGQSVKIDILPGVYVNVKCENVTSNNYKLPKCANHTSNFKSVSFKDCPLPSTSFKDVLTSIGVSKTMSLIFQNERNISLYFNRKHFTGLQHITKLLLSVNGFTHLPDNLFMDLNNLKWLNIRMKSIMISEELFKPLEKLDTLEINHNQMTNMSNKLFEHLTILRKFSLWQSNISDFSKDFFQGVKTLEELDLSSNNLSELPASIFYPLKNLKKLTLFSNRFSVLPHSLFLNNKLLVSLFVLNNNVKIKELPKLILGHLPNLKQVHIQRSGIEIISFDSFAESPFITNISLAHNEIKTLAEPVFNDQINLLELDLSYNNLRKLETKLFSSLIRLERLNLCCNSISEISGSIFSPLLSLIYLNMERNNLKVITSNLFENNRQRMSISLAFNELDFENKELDNNSWTIRKKSPFVYTYNLEMLNLSHNKFKVVFIDWWINGHEKVDLDFNSIEYLLDDVNSELPQNFKTSVKTPVKELWIGNNNLSCVCQNFWFLDFTRTHWKTKIINVNFKQCPTWSSRIICYIKFYVIIAAIVILLVITIIIMIVYFIYKKKINLLLKRICLVSFKYAFDKNKESLIAVNYTIADEEFVLKEVVPGLQNTSNKNLKVLLRPVSNMSYKSSVIKSIRKRERGGDTTLVIFSPNYLMATYSQVNIKRIRGEMLKAKNTIYVFVDIGPDNSIYAFLKEQRDPQISLMWNDVNFWGKVNTFLLSDCKNEIQNREPQTACKRNNLVNEIKKLNVGTRQKCHF